MTGDKDTQQDAPSKKRKGASNTIGLALIAVLIVGLGGLGISNFSGSLRSIGKVGNTDINAQSYYAALNSQMNALREQFGPTLTFQQAQSMGLTSGVLNQVVGATAFDDETAEFGLSVGDAQVAEEIRSIDAFKGLSGNFDRTMYETLLAQNGVSEAEFEEDLRRGQARNLLLSAVGGSGLMPQTYAETLVGFLAETRNFSWAELPETLLLDTIIVNPGDDELTEWYDANLDQFITPETRKVSYAWMTPDMILDTVDVDEESLRAAYEEQKDQFNMPERRLVERLPFVSEDEAQAAMERIENGEISFDALVEERGLNLSDIDLGDVSAADLGEAADLIFASQVGAAIGPAPSDLGSALYRVNGILEAQNTSFEDAKPALMDTLVLDRARRVISAQAEDLDDLLAGGATLEEIADESEMQFGQIDFNELSEDGIAGYPAFREAANSISTDDFPKVDELGDGGLFALRLDEIVEPATKPLDDLRDAAIEGWKADQQVAVLESKGASIEAALADGQSFEAQALEEQIEEGIDRQSFTTDLPAAIRNAAFELEPGATRTVSDAGSVYVLRLTDILAADLEDENNARAMELYGQQADLSLQEDLMGLLSTDIQSRAVVNIDQNAIAAIEAGMQ